MGNDCLLSRVDTHYGFQCLSCRGLGELQGYALTVWLLQYVYVNKNPRKPATKIILVFVDQEPIHQTGSLAV